MTETSVPHTSSTLCARSLECLRGDRRLFHALAFDLSNGGLLQVRGPNGSGKTSLLRMVCGLFPPAGGEIAWNGYRIGELGEDYHTHLAYVGHLNAVKDELNALENLRFSARLGALAADADSLRAALRSFGLEGFEHLPCRILSQGQKRRLALARLKLSAERALWVLDEPFAALDAAGIAVMCALLEEHLARGGLALLTTHQEVAISAPSMQSIELAEFAGEAARW